MSDASITTSRSTTVGRVLTVVWLAFVWCLLWGSFAVGTVLAGLLIGLGVTLFLRCDVVGDWGTVRPVAALRFAVVFLGMLVQATAQVVVAVVNPRGHVAPEVVEVALPPSTKGVVTMVANSVTLTPGTITLDASLQPDGGTVLLIHALDASDPEAIRRDTLRLHGLAAAAFGSATPQEASA
jgi:multicomponent Na+:H+ antiporter subunit E